MLWIWLNLCYNGITKYRKIGNFLHINTHLYYYCWAEGQQLWEYSLFWRGRYDSKSCSICGTQCEAAGHISYTGSRKRDECLVPHSLFLFLSTLGLLHMAWCCLQPGWVFLPQLNFSGNVLTNIPKVCNLGDSKFSQVDNQDYPSQEVRTRQAKWLFK